MQTESGQQRRPAWIVARTPGAFAVYAVIGFVGIVIMTAMGGAVVLNWDIWQWTALWAAVVATVFIFAAAERFPYRAIWTVLVVMLALLIELNYADYLSLRNRLGQIHQNDSSTATGLLARIRASRYAAEDLYRDMTDWSTASDGARPLVEARVASDLTNLDGRFQEINANAANLVASMKLNGPSSPQNLTFSESMLAPVRLIAGEVADETKVMSQTLTSLRSDWTNNRTTPEAAVVLKDDVNPRLWVAIDNAADSAGKLVTGITNATDIPIADMVAVIVVLNLALVLFPWLLLLLFVSGRRDARLGQIYIDLWDIAGENNKLLIKVLDNVEPNLLVADGYQVPTVRRKLEDRTFSDVEYLLCLIVLTVLLAAGWHMVFYPLGALGLAQLLAPGVSVRDFALYVVGNLNIITLGFLGAYMFSSGVLIRRFFASDLYPSAFLQMIFRIVTVLLISLVLTILLPLVAQPLVAGAVAGDSIKGLPIAPGGRPLDAVTAIVGALAFFFGIFTESFYRWLPGIFMRIKYLRDFVQSSPNRQPSVDELEGVDLWVEGRLNEEGIETVQAMAAVPIEKLVRRTYFSTAHIICWVDQALLFIHAGAGGEWMPRFRAAGIHKATDLIRAVGLGAALREKGRTGDGPVIGAPVDLQSVNSAVAAILIAANGSESTSKDPKLTAEIIFQVCNALWDEPNLVYIVNFYRAHHLDFGHVATQPKAEPAGGPQRAGQESISSSERVAEGSAAWSRTPRAERAAIHQP